MKKMHYIYLFLIIMFSCITEQKTKDDFNINYKIQKNALIHDTLVEHMSDNKNKGDFADIKLTTGKGNILYFDPVTITGRNNADIIFITHTHYDHFNINKINEVKNDTTIILIPEGAYIPTKKVIKDSNIVVVRPNKKYTIKGFNIETISAYTISNSIHPRSENWVGYIVTIEGVRFYISGDTDFIPDMKKLKADVVFISIGGDVANLYFGGTSKGMMNGKEASQVINIMKPEVVFPIHSFFGYNHRDLNAFLKNIDKTFKIIILGF